MARETPDARTSPHGNGDVHNLLLGRLRRTSPAESTACTQAPATHRGICQYVGTHVAATAHGILTQATGQPATNSASALHVHVDTAAIDLAAIGALVGCFHVCFCLVLYERIATALSVLVPHDFQRHNRAVAVGENGR